MKKLIIWITSIVVIVAATDIIFGWGIRYYTRNHTLKGDYRATEHLIKDSVDELVVLGSSVALNSINTKALSDSLGVSAYNGGSNGQSLPFYLTMLEIIADKPGLKTVILGMKEDGFCTTGLGPRFNLLMPYYETGHEGLDRRIESKSTLDKYLLKSSLYRYNTIWFRMLLYTIMEPGVQGERGFVAKDIPPVFPHKIPIEAIPEDTVDSGRINEFEQFVKICNDRNIRLIVCVPPRYEYAGTSAGGDYLRQRAMKKDFELWFDVTGTPLSADSTLFYDNTHLNFEGAKIYTDTIISRLRKL